LILSVVKHRDFIVWSKACLPTRPYLLEIYHGSQHREEDNEEDNRLFFCARAIERIAINRESLIGFDRRRPATLTAPKSMDAGKLDGPQFPKVIRLPRRERFHPTPVIRYSVSVRVIHLYPLYIYECPYKFVISTGVTRRAS